jgi:hypothetical protein
MKFYYENNRYEVEMLLNDDMGLDVFVKDTALDIDYQVVIPYIPYCTELGSVALQQILHLKRFCMEM